MYNVNESWRSSLRKFYGRYGDLVKQYEVPLSRMLHDILDDDHLQWHPHLSGITPVFDPITDLDLITEFDFLRNSKRFSMEHLQRVRHANRGLLLLRTPGPVSLWDLQVFKYWDKSLLNLTCFRTFEFRTSLGTSVFCFTRF